MNYSSVIYILPSSFIDNNNKFLLEPPSAFCSSFNFVGSPFLQEQQQQCFGLAPCFPSQQLFYDVLNYNSSNLNITNDLSLYTNIECPADNDNNKQWDIPGNGDVDDTEMYLLAGTSDENDNAQPSTTTTNPSPTIIEVSDDETATNNNNSGDNDKQQSFHIPQIQGKTQIQGKRRPKKPRKKLQLVLLPVILRMRQDVAAKHLGMTTSTLSKRWKEAHGEVKWPHRKILKNERKIEKEKVKGTIRGKTAIPRSEYQLVVDDDEGDMIEPKTIFVFENDIKRWGK